MLATSMAFGFMEFFSSLFNLVSNMETKIVVVSPLMLVKTEAVEAVPAAMLAGTYFIPNFALLVTPGCVELVAYPGGSLAYSICLVFP